MMTLLGLITIQSSNWIAPAIFFPIAAILLLIWSYRRAPQISIAQRIAFCLKFLGILALGFCLVEPLWSGRRAESGANLLVVAADNSSGMNIRDRSSAVSRADILRDLLQRGKTQWLATLADDFKIRQYIFDSQLKRAVDFNELTFSGNMTAIGATLHTIAERYRNRSLAGVVLMTDGNATDMGDKQYDLTDVPPVYPVVIGGSQSQRDICLANISVSQTSFEDAPVMIQADVQAGGYAGRKVAVDLLEESGTLIERKQWNVSKSDEREVFRFNLKPDKTGVLAYCVKVTETGNEKSEDKFIALEEATLANNHRTIVINRGKGPYRILYVAGRPNWEYKFLQRAISKDQQVQMVGLLRVAKREPKYDWRGRSGERNNPLYRGFDKDPEEAEQYDQPVLVRLNTRDEAELIGGFPTTPEELFGYHAIILDDVEAEFFTHDQMALIRRFVSERGGGFLMLGGKDSFLEGNYAGTDIGAILPVYLNRLDTELTAEQIRLSLTREGLLQPWARLYDNELKEQERQSQMPDFQVLNRIRTVKPGARIIAAIDEGQTKPLPGLAVQRFGNGRTAALTIGDIWRWGLQEAELHEDMDKFWRQTLRWLVADVPEKISIEEVQSSNEDNQAIKLKIHARDNKFEPLHDVAVTIEVHEPGDDSVKLTAEPETGKGGVFEATYVPRISGAFRAKASVADPEGNEIGNAEMGWSVNLDTREFQSIAINRKLLENIARQTGGHVIEASELIDFARDLPTRNVPVTTVWIKPLWDLPGLLPTIFLLILLSFIAEWVLRRWEGLP